MQPSLHSMTLPTRTSVSSELAQTSWTLMELFEMDRHQLQQAAAMVILSDINTNAQQQCSIKEMASKLATSSSSSATVGEKVARTTVGPTCSAARIAATSDASVATNRRLPSRET